MTTTQVREVTAARLPSGPEITGTEPSHIHIPRPSRVRQANVTQCDDQAIVQAPLELVLDEAA